MAPHSTVADDSVEPATETILTCGLGPCFPSNTFASESGTILIETTTETNDGSRESRASMRPPLGSPSGVIAHE